MIIKNHLQSVAKTFDIVPSKKKHYVDSHVNDIASKTTQPIHWRPSTIGFTTLHFTQHTSITINKGAR